MVSRDRHGKLVFEELLVQNGRFPEGLEQKITAIVRSHFPAEIPADIPFETELHIIQIYVSFNRGILEFKDAVPSDDSKKIARIIKKIEKAKSEIRKLSTGSLLALWAIEERADPRLGKYDKTLRPLEQAARNLQKLKRMNSMSRRVKKVDWRAMALAKECKSFWEKHKGTAAPISIHNDALGPFGRFLQDCLDAVAATLRPESEPPRAASVMRALNDISRKR